MKPRISWLAPIYNKEAWIGDTIENIQKQTLKDFELIFVDDGSTDATADIIKHYMKTDKRIRLVRLKKNMGLGVAWNIATREAKSPIILVASGDDLWMENRGQLSYDFFKKHPKADVFYGSFAFTDAQMKPVEYKPAVPFSAQRMLKKRKDGRCPQFVGHFTMAYRTKVAKRVPYREDLKVGIDYPFLCDLIKAGASFGWTNKMIGFARLLPSGVSMSRPKEVALAGRGEI